MSRLDRSEAAGVEQTWLVVTARSVEVDDRMAGGLGIRGEANVKVTAASMDVLDGGTLVFRSERGALSWAFGPGGWLEVSRA